MHKGFFARASLCALALTIMLGCVTTGQSFSKGIQRAQDRVFPALVFLKPIQQTLRTGERTLSQVFGSGVIISPDGLVVTNSHVARDSTTIKCVLFNREQLPARVLGFDVDTDLALLQIELPQGHAPLPVAEFGDSDKLTYGEFVMALGSPLGFERSISFGVVSSPRRYLEVGAYSLWIQTDAAINPGNSGGPLVNDQGKVIGINTLTTRAAENIGFAIPSNTVKSVIEQLRKNGHVQRSYTGIQVQPIKDFLRDVVLDYPKGVLIGGVDAQSPAASAGLIAGDLLLSCNGQEILGLYMEDIPGVRTQLAALPLDRPAEMLILRDTKVLTVAVTPVVKQVVARDGMELEEWNLSTQEITQTQTPGLAYFVPRGVYLYGVKQDGNGARSGLRPGDIIVSINDEPVQTLDGLLQTYKRLNELPRGERTALFEILRAGYRYYITLDFNRESKPAK